MVSRKSIPGHPEEHDVRSLASLRLTAGSSPLYIYLCTPGSAYKSPGYHSCVGDDGAVITISSTRESKERVETRGPLLLPLKQLKEHSL